MAGKAKFDQEAAFKSIIRPKEQADHETGEEKLQKDRVQRSYLLDRDIDKALRLKALTEDKNLTESVNEVLRNGLAEYLEKQI